MMMMMTETHLNADISNAAVYISKYVVLQIDKRERTCGGKIPHLLFSCHTQSHPVTLGWHTTLENGNMYLHITHQLLQIMGTHWKRASKEMEMVLTNIDDSLHTIYF